MTPELVTLLDCPLGSGKHTLPTIFTLLTLPTRFMSSLFHYCPTGSGKRTLSTAIGYDLGRVVKNIHVADLADARGINNGQGNDLAALEAVVSGH